jgi:uncharacterized membrane protein YbhN (UPF0104 family)
MRVRWRLLGSGALLAALAWRLDWGQLAAAFAGLDWARWGAAAGLLLLAQVASAVRWQLMARAAGLGGSWRQYQAYYFIGMLFNVVLPTSVGGDVVRAWYLARQPGPSPASGRARRAFVSVLADRASGLAVLVALCCAATAAYPGPLPAGVGAAATGVGAAAVLGVALVPLSRRLLAAAPFASPRLDGLRRLADDAASYLRDARLLAAATALSAAVQLVGLVCVGLIGSGLGLPVPPLYYGVLVPLVTLLTLLPVSVSGVGVREAGMALLLAPLGIGPAPAAALGVLTFAAYVVVSLVGLPCYLFGGLPRLGELNAEPEAGDDGAAGGPRAAA